MARIRTLKPEAWIDEKLGPLPRDQRLLFVGLITIADDQGRLRDVPASIIGHAFPYDEDVTPTLLDSWLAGLEDAGLVVRYEVASAAYLALPGWSKHQKISHPSKPTLPPPSEERRSGSGETPEALRPDQDQDQDQEGDQDQDDQDPRDFASPSREPREPLARMDGGAGNEGGQVDEVLAILRPAALVAGQQVGREGIEKAIAAAADGVDVVHVARTIVKEARSGSGIRSLAGVFAHRCRSAEPAQPRAVQNGVPPQRGCDECDGGFVVDEDNRTATPCPACMVVAS
jgi:hypothetical protein